jgi:hypothetical protein
MADASRAPKFDIPAAFYLPCYGPSTAAFLRLQTVTSVRSDDQPLREEPVPHEPALTPWRSPEPLAAKERLDHPVQRPLVDVAAEALVQAVTEVEILVVLTTWVEAVRLRNPPVIHHGRGEGREDRGALRDRPRPLRAARQRPVGLRDAWQARPIGSKRIASRTMRQSRSSSSARAAAAAIARASGRRSSCSSACGTTMGG